MLNCDLLWSNPVLSFYVLTPEEMVCEQYAMYFT